MPGISKIAIWAGLESLYFSGAHRLARNFVGGLGTILTFHHVRPALPDAFQPNRGIEITPAFLEEAVTGLRRADVEIVSIDEARERIVAGKSAKRFVVLTFDDGFRDNLEFAWPILKRHGVPFTMYVASSFADGTGVLWWVVLERAVARNDRIEVDLDGAERTFDCSTLQAKCESFSTLYWWLRARERQEDIDKVIAEIAFGYGIDTGKLCRELCMGWDELSTLAADPLVTIGSHTVSHPFLAKLSADAVRAEMAGANRRIAEKLGKEPQHFAYPVGDHGAAGPRDYAIASELGYRTAVTTEPGVLFARHGGQLSALPRISVNGEFQRLRYLDVLMSGAPTALMNAFRRGNAA
ncbi:polysaccharide deacetylase family protein [soil metagenome]